MKTQKAIEALGALAHEHRLAIFRLLMEQGPNGLPAGVIGERIGLVPSTLTFHLQNLQRSGLAKCLRSGRQLVYSVDFDAMNGLIGYLTDNCCAATGETCDVACKPAPNKARRRPAKVA
jgi:DNA-binding transcriptional ArsR family regulator